jgi:hypothetical protein
VTDLAKELERSLLPAPVERMLIGYDDNRTPFILCRRGPSIECEERGIPADEIGISGPPDCDRPTSLWVYDVLPTYRIRSEEWAYGGGVFRRPSEDEWRAIREGDMVGLFHAWGDVCSRSQWDEWAQIVADGGWPAPTYLTEPKKEET